MRPGPTYNFCMRPGPTYTFCMRPGPTYTFCMRPGPTYTQAAAHLQAEVRDGHGAGVAVCGQDLCEAVAGACGGVFAYRSGMLDNQLRWYLWVELANQRHQWADRI